MSDKGLTIQKIREIVEIGAGTPSALAYLLQEYDGLEKQLKACSGEVEDAEGQLMGLKEGLPYLITQATPETQELINYILSIPNVTELREFMNKAGAT